MARPPYFEAPLPRVFAHRGLAIDAPENTMLAFARALTVGDSYLETDAHASADGHAILSHDADLTRIAARDGAVRQLTATELRRIDLGHGQGFATLAEALDGFPDARFNIDIKSDAAVAPVVAAIRDARATNRVLVTSFSERRRRAAVTQLPGVATSAASAEVARALLSRAARLTPLLARSVRGIHALQVPETYKGIRLVTPRLVDAAHRVGVEVHVWTVNEPDDMRRLLALGIDGLVTDRCDVAWQVVRDR